jgi:hypothetical protein
VPSTGKGGGWRTWVTFLSKKGDESARRSQEREASRDVGDLWGPSTSTDGPRWTQQVFRKSLLSD